MKCTAPKCTRLAHGKFGPADAWMCFWHGFEYLDTLRETYRQRREDRCEDGPWCGCDQHRALEDGDE